jgi:hypothetical protein
MKKMPRMKLKFALRLLPALILVATALPALALMVPMGTEDLVSEASAAVVGQVREVRSFWSANKKVIRTHAVVDVTTNVFGLPTETKTVVVEFDGGEIDGLRLDVCDTPSFTPNEKVLVFLAPRNALGADSTQKRAAEGPVFAPAGMAQGKYAVNAVSMASRSGFTLANGKTDANSSMQLTDLIRSVQVAAKNCGKLP